MVDTLSSGQPDLVRQVRPKLTDPAQVLLPLGLPCANPLIPRLLESQLHSTIRRFAGPWCPDYRQGRGCCPTAASTSISPSCRTGSIGETLTSVLDLTWTMSQSLAPCALAAEPPAFCPLLLAIRQFVGNLSYQAIGLAL